MAITNNVLRPPKAPNLPIGPVEYDQRYQDQLLNVLRLYFNTIDNFSQQFVAETGGAYLKFPYLSAYQDGYTTLSANMTNNSTTPIQVASTTEFESAGYLLIGDELVQYTGKTSTTFTGITRGVKGTTNKAHTAGVYISEATSVAANGALALKLDNVISSNQIVCTVPDSKIYFEKSGTYNIQFSAQILNFYSQDDNITIWFKKNGNPIDHSASIQQVSSIHANGPGAIIIALNFVDEFVFGDYVELFWSSVTGYPVLATYPPNVTSGAPASPSLILTVQFVSAPTT